MNRIFRSASLAACSGILACLTVAPALAGITEISIGVNSQAISRPPIDNVWSASGSVLSAAKGIGIIVKPTWISANDHTDFALHQHQDLGSPAYKAPYVPNEAASTATYKFDRPTTVTAVEIVQHINGVTQVKGAVDCKLISPVFGPSGDVVGSYVVPSDGTSQVFRLNNSTPGMTFKLTISKTSHAYAFALHRAFLIDERGQRIPLAPNPVGGTVSGVSGQKDVGCYNLTTGQKVFFAVTGTGWNCEQHGLIVKPGQVVEQRVRASK